MVVAMHGQGMEDARGAPMATTANYEQRPGKEIVTPSVLRPKQITKPCCRCFEQTPASKFVIVAR